MPIGQFRRRALLAAAISLFILTPPLLRADTVKQLNLAELVKRADKIYRGRVISVTPSTVEVGGGQLPVVTYRLLVEEVFQGDFPIVKGVKTAELRMLGKMKPVTVGNLRWNSPLPRMPEMAVGKTYLVFATRPSTVGLSATVGLGQGSFQISQVGKDERAVNEVNNRGLYRDMSAPASAQGRALAAALTGAASGGPVTYNELAQQIRAQLGR